MLRWKGGKPEETDLISFQNLLGALPKGLKRVVFTSSAGVERQGSFPYIILNLFGAIMMLSNRQSRYAATASGCESSMTRAQCNTTMGPYGHHEWCRRAEV